LTAGNTGSPPVIEAQRGSTRPFSSDLPKAGMLAGMIRGTVADPELAEACRRVIDRLLEPDEGVWAVIRGRDGTTLVGTDRRLFALGPDCTDHDVRAWPYRQLDDLRVVGSSILVRTRLDRRQLVTLPTSHDRREQTLQGVTIVELLIARHARAG
jgi:hypothetical protein